MFLILHLPVHSGYPTKCKDIMHVLPCNYISVYVQWLRKVFMSCQLSVI